MWLLSPFDIAISQYRAIDHILMGVMGVNDADGWADKNGEISGYEIAEPAGSDHTVMYRLLCFAHRGASGHEPENTLSAVKRAINLRADWIEVDVYAIEGELLVIHDDRLERTTNGTGYVMDKTLAYLRSLNAGKGQCIPTLREVFECVDGRVGINVELKGPDTADSTVSLISEYICGRHWRYDQFIVSSIDRRQLMKVKMNDPRIRIGVIVDPIHRRYIRFARIHALFSVHPRFDLVTAKFIRRARELGLKIFVYNVNDPDEIGRLERLEVDGVFTDFPELVTERCR